MCQVCTDWEKGKMTNQEALKALGEMIESDKSTNDEVTHYFDLEDKILDKEEEDS
jgi:hypothetical protein